MKKRVLIRILILSLLFIFAVISGCSIPERTPAAKAATSIESCNQLPESGASFGSGRDDCLRNLAVKEDDISICNIIKSEDEKDQCFMVMARKLNDISICDSSKRQYDKDYCIYNFMFANLDKIEYCNEIKDEDIKDACLCFNKVNTIERHNCRSQEITKFEDKKELFKLSGSIPTTSMDDIEICSIQLYSTYTHRMYEIGLRTGVKIIKFDDNEVKSKEDFNKVLRNHKAGDIIKLVTSTGTHDIELIQDTDGRLNPGFSIKEIPCGLESFYYSTESKTS